MVPRPRNGASSVSSGSSRARMSVSSGPSEFAEPPSWEDETEEYVLALGGYDQDEGRSPGPAEQHQGSSSSSAEQQQTAQVAATSGAGDRQPSPSPALGNRSHPPRGQGPDDAADYAHRTVKSYDLGEKFTGTDKQANSLEVYEFISRVKAHLKLLNIPPCNHYQYLLLNTRLAAYNTLTNNVRLPINDPQAFEKGILVLQERFGVGRHDLWALARTRRLNVGETTSDLMGDLQKYLSYSLPEVLNISRQCLDWVVVMSFWHSLPSSLPGLDNLRTTWLSQVREGAPLVETALNLTRSVRVEGQEGVALVQSPSHYSRPSGKGKHKGKGYPPRGAGKSPPVHRSISRSSPSQVPRCFNCNGRGHISRNCPSPRKVLIGEWSWLPDYAVHNHLILSCRFNSPDQSEDAFTALIDSGSTVTVISQSACERIFGRSLPCDDEPFHVTTLSGRIALHRTVTFHCLLGVRMRILISPVSPLLRLQSRDIDVMLGMDWLHDLGATVTLHPGTEPPWTISPLGRPSDPSVGLALSTLSCETTIDEPDFILRRRSDSGPSRFYWEVEWKWLSGKEPSFPILKPPSFPESVTRLTSQQKVIFYDQLRMWVRNGFLLPTHPSQLKGVLTCFPHVSMDKHTKVRPVLNYVWLNDLLISCPHSQGPLTTCLGELRSWRTCNPHDWFIIDVTTAYLKLRVAPHQQYWQGIIIPDWPEPNTFRLSRVGFGLHIAGKALDRALSHRLTSTRTAFPVKKYVDDVAVHRTDLSVVQRALAEDDLATKPPTPLAGSSVLGVTITPTGRWVRKKPLDLDTIPSTRKHLASLLGKLTAHYPVCSWLRITCAMFTRILALAAPAAKHSYDYPLPSNLRTAYSHLIQYIRMHGDPVGGDWQVSLSDPWTLYTDGSSLGCAAVFCIGSVICEDRSWLRDRNCRRHINVVEAESVVRGLGIVVDYIQAFHIPQCCLTVRTDNTSVVAWLSRSANRHWTKIHGLFRHAVESRIQLIHDICRNYHITLTVTHVPTTENLADVPSRLPQPLSREILGLVQEYATPGAADSSALVAVQAPSAPSLSTQNRDLRDWLQQFPIRDGKVLLPPHLIGEFLSRVHDHEGHAAMLSQCREYIEAPGLASAIESFHCEACSRGKAFPGDRQPFTSPRHLPRAPFPFVRIHSDIAGPYLRSVDGTTRFYLTSVIDSCSNFLLVRPTQHPPNSHDVCSLLMSLVHTFHVVPLMLHSDNGTQYSSMAMADLIESWDAIHLFTPRGSSPSNGRVERVHRYLNEYLRTHHDGKGISYTTFCDLIHHAVYSWNVTKRGDVSPHSSVYSFPASMGMHVPRQCRQGHDYVDSCVVDPPPEQVIPTGTRVLVRCPSPLAKLNFRWYTAIIIRQVSANVFITKADVSGHEVSTHSRDIKLLLSDDGHD